MFMKRHEKTIAYKNEYCINAGQFSLFFSCYLIPTLCKNRAKRKRKAGRQEKDVRVENRCFLERGRRHKTAGTILDIWKVVDAHMPGWHVHKSVWNGFRQP